MAPTEGPLDEVFGQHSVFPVEGDHSDEVQQYLRLVRAEAESEAPFFYRDNKSKETAEIRNEIQTETPAEIQTDTPTTQNEISTNGTRSPEKLKIDPVWRQSVYESFLEVKQEFKTTTVSPDFSIPTSANGWRELVFQQDPPGHQFFAQLDHANAIKLVIYLTKWLSVTLPVTVSRWIYWIFVRVDCLLDASEKALVRDMGVKARKLALKIDSSPADIISPWAKFTFDFVLVIMADYYGQRDLIDNE